MLRSCPVFIWKFTFFFFHGCSVLQDSEVQMNLSEALFIHSPCLHCLCLEVGENLNRRDAQKRMFEVKVR